MAGLFASTSFHRQRNWLNAFYASSSWRRVIFFGIGIIIFMRRSRKTEISLLLIGNERYISEHTHPRSCLKSRCINVYQFNRSIFRDATFPRAWCRPHYIVDACRACFIARHYFITSDTWQSCVLIMPTPRETGKKSFENTRSCGNTNFLVYCAVVRVYTAHRDINFYLPSINYIYIHIYMITNAQRYAYYCALMKQKIFVWKFT